jgi:hypothetical protein
MRGGDKKSFSVYLARGLPSERYLWKAVITQVLPRRANALPDLTLVGLLPDKRPRDRPHSIPSAFRISLSFCTVLARELRNPRRPHRGGSRANCYVQGSTSSDLRPRRGICSHYASIIFKSSAMYLPSIWDVISKYKAKASAFPTPFRISPINKFVYRKIGIMQVARDSTHHRIDTTWP